MFKSTFSRSKLISLFILAQSEKNLFDLAHGIQSCKYLQKFFTRFHAVNAGTFEALYLNSRVIYPGKGPDPLFRLNRLSRPK